MLTVKKLYDDLDYWIHIGIGDDIVNLPDHRPEYQHLVKQNLKKYNHELERELIPGLVLIDLNFELKKPWFMRPTFWVLLWLQIKRIPYIW